MKGNHELDFCELSSGRDPIAIISSHSILLLKARASSGSNDEAEKIPRTTNQTQDEPMIPFPFRFCSFFLRLNSVVLSFTAAIPAMHDQNPDFAGVTARRLHDPKRTRQAPAEEP